MANDYTIDLSQLPAPVLRGALEKYTSFDWSNKANAVTLLAASIRNGALTLKQIKEVAPYFAASWTSGVASGTQGVQHSPISHHIATVASDVADRALQTALDASTAINRLGDRALAAEIHVSSLYSSLESDIKAVRGEVSKISDMIPADMIATEVTAKIAAAFKQFEVAVKDAGAEAAIGSMVSVTKQGSLPVSEVFGVMVTDTVGNELMVDIYNDASSPSVDPHFVWTKGILKHLLLSQATGENLWFGGEKGTGKSETVRQFAAKTGRGYCRINFHKYTTSEDYIGSVGLENGDTVFKEGDFLRAFSTPATLILLDEITNADPAALATLNGFLEPSSAVSYGGSVRRRAPAVLVFAADNTLTNGDESGRYAGTRSMNSALADRFARVVAFKHMDIDTEVEAVVRHTGCKPELAEHILRAVHACRAKVASGDIVDAPSIRQVMAFVRSVAVLGVNEAWAASIGHRQPSESATAIEGIKSAYISATYIEKLLADIPTPTPTPVITEQTEVPF
jgi:MoxR-like ATPase